MGRNSGSSENKLRGYKAATHNPRVSNEARAHAQQEADKLSNYTSDEERHEENVKRGLKAAVHNPRVTESGRKGAKDKLNEMGAPAE
ncbi:conidiation protein Con-6 [Penicillium brasilianum]|uniref:Conidiation protein Con-6 n=1 Tax=Penicillium brasilianum TaxID=104259 RepID=A0A1S9RDN5_PENBI|nr:conidiation protein Con-6 [Penicillium brasilianum]